MVERHLRIASYNIRKAKGLDRRRDPGRVLDVINDLQADIVVLQEADLRLGQRKAALPRDMISGYTDFMVAPLAQYEDSLGWHGNAVLTRPGISVSSTMRLDLPGLEPRGAAVLNLSGETEITLVATHLGLRRRDRRVQQAAICAALPGFAKTIVAGDFNEWSAAGGLEHFERNMKVHTPGRSFPTRLPLAGLDRFVVSEGLDIVASGVERGAKARRASDHLPVWCAVNETQGQTSTGLT